MLVPGVSRNNASVNFAWIGGGCSNTFYHIYGTVGRVDGTADNSFSGYACNTSNGNAITIQPGVPYTAVWDVLSSQNLLKLSVYNQAGGLIGSLSRAGGFPVGAGPFDTLSLGLVSNADWPSCSGYVDRVEIEPLVP